MGLVSVVAFSTYGIFLCTANAWAAFCTMQLEEQASVFELNCPDADPGIPCSIAGHFFDVKTYAGYQGLIASIWSGAHHPDAKKNNQGTHTLTAVVHTYRNGPTLIEAPIGLWNALKLAIDIKSSSRRQVGDIGLYFDARLETKSFRQK